ncbi:ABC transporter ATP-binding protein [Schlesneria sp. DSM 10557]|uniref:ABC transporter ATP-binding protein n=1 Tax=Schlesneria sp. DSM 10557 TaxID=3044399 RepID=UPI0035A07C5E
MSDFALRVEGLTKSFRLGHRVSYHRFSELIENVATNLARLPRRLMSARGASQTNSPEMFQALDDVSFEIQRGEVVGFIGRNGAGKSTLLKLLSRITYPTHGRIEIRGRVGSLLEVGTGFHPELTGRENIFMNGAVLGMTRREIRKKFDEIVAFSEVERFLDTAVKHYSSGMYVRLAFAVAAHLEPEILIVDEVLAVGDAAFQQKCLGKMGSASRQGKTVLIVSHSLPVITNLCKRAILLEKGKITANGTPAEVVKQYLANVRSASGEVVWPSQETAPGNDMVRLHAVRVVQSEVEGATADVDIAHDISVKISYWNLIPNQQLYAALWLKDSNGTFVLATSNVKAISLTDDPWYGTPQPVGLFESTCTIPGNFLNEGRYTISAIVGRVPQKTTILQESVLTFDVHDTGSMREEYFGNWTGPVIRPRLPWNTVQS